MLKIAIVVSHPIQHFCPQYVSFARRGDIHLRVFFASALGSKAYEDPDFQQVISWGNLRLNEFDHIFLNGEVILPADKHLDAPGLDAALTTFTPDLVIMYGYFQKMQRRAYRWGRKHRVKLAYISDSERRQTRSRLKEMIKYPLLRWYFSHISYFLTVGDANELFYKHYGVTSKRMIRMHFPIDLHTYKQVVGDKSNLRKKIREQYLIGEHETVTAVVGKLVPWKNQDDIIAAMQLLESQNVFLHLFIIGSGEMLTAWKEKAAVLKQSKVHFTGFVDIDSLPAYYAASDFYTHPASVEPHSIAVSEAIYMGCPVIMSDRCGSYGKSDDVQEGINGFIYKFGDTNALAAAISILSSQKDRRTAMSHQSSRIGREFQERSHGTAIADLIKKVI